MISLTEFKQLIKIPELIEHFAEHKTKHKDISFWEFLAIHYSASGVNDLDYDEDMKLPFKTHEGFMNAMIEVSLPRYSNFIITKPIPTGITTFFAFNESFLNPSFLSSIWQPPKAC